MVNDFTHDGRIEYVDIAKGIAILSVIVGHMGWKYMTAIVYSFHIPLFLICSGYFISEKKDFRCFRREKARRLFLPYITTGVCLCFLSAAFNFVRGTGEQTLQDFAGWLYALIYGADISYEDPFAIKGIGPIWFLLALFWSFLIVKYFGAMKEGAVIVGLLAYMAYISSKYVWLPFSIQAGAFSALFVYVGYALRKYGFAKKKFNIVLFIFAVGLWIFEVCFEITLDVGCITFNAGGFGILGGIIICYAVFQIAKLCSHIIILKKSLTFFGKNSLLILCFHEIETYFFPGSIVYSVAKRIGMSGAAIEGMILVIKIFICTICTLTALKIANKPLQYLGFVSKGKYR